MDKPVTEIVLPEEYTGNRIRSGRSLCRCLSSLYSYIASGRRPIVTSTKNSPVLLAENIVNRIAKSLRFVGLVHVLAPSIFA